MHNMKRIRKNLSRMTREQLYNLHTNNVYVIDNLKENLKGVKRINSAIMEHLRTRNADDNAARPSIVFPDVSAE